MKKRSLFAAVAMLIVSAVVLTSATYAWFASGTEVTVSTVSADVSNSDGSIKISADGSNWKTTLANADLQAVASNILPAAFTPVSIQPSNLNVVAGSITDGAFAAGSTAMRQSMVTTMALVVVSSGANRSALTPFMIP